MTKKLPTEPVDKLVETFGANALLSLNRWCDHQIVYFLTDYFLRQEKTMGYISLVPEAAGDSRPGSGRFVRRQHSCE